jgi:hypothetical protein
MKTAWKLFLLLIPVLLTACISSSCPPESVTYLEPPYPSEISGEGSGQQLMAIKGEEVLVDRVITGPVCNDTWSGTVYLTCDIQVPAWEEDPFFWQDCDLEIAEGAQVYVEAHKDKLYTDGCSCHE